MTLPNTEAIQAANYVANNIVVILGSISAFITAVIGLMIRDRFVWIREMNVVTDKFLEFQREQSTQNLKRETELIEVLQEANAQHAAALSEVALRSNSVISENTKTIGALKGEVRVLAEAIRANTRGIGGG